MAFGNNKKKDRNFETITAPLSTIMEELNTYNDEQRATEKDLEDLKQVLDAQIATSREEQQKASVTARNIKSFMDPTKILVTEDAKVDNGEVPDGEEVGE